MINAYLKLICIITLSIVLLPFSSTLNANVFGQEVNNLGSGLNVTKDMLDLLSSATGGVQNEQIDSDLDSNNTSLNKETDNKQGEALAGKDFTIKPSYSIFLEDKNMPERSFMYMYDVFPYLISEAQLTAKLPCNEDNLSNIDILGGRMPNFDKIFATYIPQFSDTGELCLYQTIISSNTTKPISEIALFNNSTEDIGFSPTSTIVISIANLTRMDEDQGINNIT